MNKGYKPLIILFVLAVLIVIIGYFIANQSTGTNQDKFIIWGEILKNIGFTVLTLVIISVLWNLLGGDPVEKSIDKLEGTLTGLQDSVNLLGDSKNTGLERIFAVSGEYGSHKVWMNRLKSAQTNIDLLGYSLLVWTKGENFEDEIIKLISKGVTIRVLIMDESNSELSAFMNTTQIKSITIDSVKENIRISKSVFADIKNKLTDENRNKLQLKTLKNGIIPLQICRTDSEITMVQYIFSEIASRSPLLLVKGERTSLFKIYLNEFEQLWKLGDLIQDEREAGHNNA